MALGCFFVVAVLALIVGVAAFGIVFLESGANSGEVKLENAEAYAPGTAAFVASKNTFLVRLSDGSFLALLDLDSANRANQAQHCRVNLLPIDEPGTGATTEQLQGRISVAARGSSSILYESCFGSIYDIAGIRLNGTGPNLDRYRVSIDDAGRVLLDTTKRQCSQRTSTSESIAMAC